VTLWIGNNSSISVRMMGDNRCSFDVWNEAWELRIHMSRTAACTFLSSGGEVSNLQTSVSDDVTSWHIGDVPRIPSSIGQLEAASDSDLRPKNKGENDAYRPRVYISFSGDGQSFQFTLNISSLLFSSSGRCACYKILCLWKSCHRHPVWSLKKDSIHTHLHH
jgi:hypothetical protein